MRFTGLRANADVIGRRVQVSWGWKLAEGEGIGDIPPVTLRRKTRDWEFPPPAADDPFLVYADAAFPPPGTTLAEVDLGMTLEGDGRAIAVADSASAVVAGAPREVLRRTIRTTVDALERPVAREVTVLDSNGDHLGLTPGVVCYYQLDGAPAPASGAGAARATATPGEAYGHGRILYGLLPDVLRRHDIVRRPQTTGTDAVPEAAAGSGQLRRLVDLFGAGLDAMRSTADGLTGLNDVDHADARFLGPLARWIGWDLSVAAPVPIQRHEIKYAAALYRITGTIPGCLLWVRRLSGWSAQIKEFSQNVMFTNDLGNPDDPNDRGSRTVDTADGDLLEQIKTAADEIDYTYTTGDGPDDWYAYNVIGIFVTPDPADSVADVVRKKGRILANTGLFLPFNLRAVVIEDIATTAIGGDVALDVQGGTDQETTS